MSLRKLLPRVALAAALLLCAGHTSAQVVATIDAVSGSVSVTLPDGSSGPASIGQRISRGQILSTAAGAEVHATLEDGGFIALRPNSSMAVSQFRGDRDGSAVLEMSLLRGTLRSITGWIGRLQPAGYRVVTPTATVGVRGTDHETTFVELDGPRDAAGTYDLVHEGATFIRTSAGEIAVDAGRHGFAPRDGVERPRLLDAAPEFMGNRALRIEERILWRKEELSRRVQQIVEERPRVGAVIERARQADDDARDNVRQQLRRRLQQRKVN